MSQLSKKPAHDQRSWGRFAWRAIGVSLFVALLLVVGGIFVASPDTEVPHAVPAQSSEPEAPADAPHFPQMELRRPAPPVAYNQIDQGWIRFDYPPDVRQQIQPLVEQANQIRDEFRERFGRDVLHSVAVRIARTPSEMVTLAPEGVPYPSYASGVAYSQIGLVLLTVHPEYVNAEHNLLEIFRHELAHVALYDAVGGKRVPRWFNEGFAIHLSRESSLSRVGVLWGATVAGRLVPIADLDRAFFTSSERASLAYAQSADIVRHLLRAHDSQRFMKMLRQVSEGEEFSGALRDAFGLDLTGLDYEWRSEVEARYSIWPVLLSGSVVWVGTLALFAFGWQRRRRQQQVVLDRWTLEEAAEDLRREELLRSEARLHVLLSPKPPEPSVSIFPNPASDRNVPAAALSTSVSSQAVPRPATTVVPKVEHDGNWHTLH